MGYNNTPRKYKGRYTVPQDKKKACLGRDGTYSRKNCNKEDYYSQGIGNG